MKLSIIIPTYNRAHILPRAIESIYKQQDENIEIIVVDDCSTDNTLNLLKSYPEIILLKTEKNSGACAARNLGIDIASGDLIYFLDSDNELTHDAVSQIKKCISTCNESYDIFFFNCENAHSSERMGRAPSSEGIVYYQDMLCGRFRGEFPPVVHRRAFEAGYRFENTKAGGEGILWLSILKRKPGYFWDISVQRYYTDSSGRTDTAVLRIARAESFARNTDRYLELFGNDLLHLGNKSYYMNRLAASGWYWLLADHPKKARERFYKCLSLGLSFESLLGVLISFGSSKLAKRVFELHYQIKLKWSN
jgi:glycosyltransferase involved in cell wall biosynthesis